jgi:uncharacterized phiE125 gp8 family phage protein
MLVASTPADGEAILPLALLKARVRVLADDEDTDIERMRAQAIDYIERTLGKSLQQREFVWSTNQFCASMLLPVGPVLSVDAVSYYATDGTDTELEEGDWLYSGGALMPAIGTEWPEASEVPGSVRVTFTAGFEDAETEAPMLIAAVEVTVAALRDNREAPDFRPAINVASSYWSPAL